MVLVDAEEDFNEMENGIGMTNFLGSSVWYVDWLIINNSIRDSF